ncbi:hypothetical protein BJV82DRAFT_626037 [Fennellomyces sp. T-0311]|nr:hypothetical protein BJV82DRAFT_626037 [Fennellomyces sp. T-0311]
MSSANAMNSTDNTQQMLAQVLYQIGILQRQVNDLQTTVSESVAQMSQVQEQITALTRKQAMTAPIVLPELPSRIERVKGYEPIDLQDRVIVAPVKPDGNSKKSVKPQDIKSFLTSVCGYTERITESLYAGMIEKAGSFGVELLHAKYAPIGGIKECDKEQRLTVEENLSRFMEQAYGVPMRNCERNWVAKGAFAIKWTYLSKKSATAQKNASAAASANAVRTSTSSVAAPSSTMPITSAPRIMQPQSSMMSMASDDPSGSIVAHGSTDIQRVSSSSSSLFDHPRASASGESSSDDDVEGEASVSFGAAPQQPSQQPPQQSPQQQQQPVFMQDSRHASFTANATSRMLPASRAFTPGGITEAQSLAERPIRRENRRKRSLPSDDAQQQHGR